MWKYINDTLMEFKGCFSRKAAFKWFVIVVVGLMVRSDHLGVTSIIRELEINPKYYESLLHFFCAKSWKLEEIKGKWAKIVAKSEMVHRVYGKLLLIGDGVKAIKEGRRMPCVKKLAQESENSSKPSYIHGHMFGAIGILLGTPKKFFCTLLSMRIHDGNEVIGEWAGDELAHESHVVRLVREACSIAEQIGESCRLALDRYYLTTGALAALNQFGANMVSIVTKAKNNAVAYRKPSPKSGRGRPSVKGDKIKLYDLFSTHTDSFQKAVVNIYGKTQDVEFFVSDLLWGKKLYQELRFVLVKYQGKFSILVSTDLSLSAEQFIEIYAFRFKIESAFRELKQVISGFAYHFWSRYMPKINRFAKNDVMAHILSSINDTAKKSFIISALNAIEAFASFALISFGLLQISALRFHRQINASAFRWIRTSRSDFPSEATTAHFLRKTIFNPLHFSPLLPINLFIRSVQLDYLDSSTA